MVATFLGAIATMMLGVAGLGKSSTSKKDLNKVTNLMTLRVALCALLLVEIIFYVTYLKP